jgi:hypothetical protein
MSLARAVKTALRRRRGHVVEFVRHGRAAKTAVCLKASNDRDCPSPCLPTYLNADIDLWILAPLQEWDVFFELQKSEIKCLKV